MRAPTPGRNARLAAFLAAALVPLALAGCQTEPTTPTFYADLGQPGAEVDAAAAVSLINDYRAKEGRPPLTLDPKLSEIAREQATALAAADSIRLSLAADRTIERRLEKAGYPSARAVENTSAGYRTLAEAFSGWRESRGHNANMLDAEATRFGIATAYAPTSKYKVFWTAIFVAGSP
jgi:uncharacterized protein YkwD